MRAGRPPVGFGTAPARGLRPLDLVPAIAAALEAGCGLLDTAEVYGTEPLIGRLLAERGAGRAGLRLVSKLWQSNHAAEHVLEACAGSLRRLGVERLDLYLVHSPDAWPSLGPLEVDPGWSAEEIAARVTPARGDGPAAAVPLEETWEAMLELRRRGLTREVGVANFDLPQLEVLASYGDDRPAVLQVEMHPLRPRPELLAYCRERDIGVMAHTPLGGGAVLADPRLVEAARRAGLTPAQAVLHWHLARGVVPVPGSRRPAHVREDLATPETEAPPELLELVGSLSDGQRRRRAAAPLVDSRDDA